MATVGTGLDDSGSHSQLRIAVSAEQVSARATFRVLRHNLPELNVRIGRLARRAGRLGTAPLALREVGEGDGEHALVVLEGEPPALGGWTLAAVVDHRGGAPRVRVASSAAPVLDSRRFREPCCDHCRLRRRRVETFVVWHATTQRLRQVGTGCLRDFLGGHDPERVCRQAEYVLLARESLAVAASPRRAPAGADDGVALAAFAAHAAMVLRAHGWVSRERARVTGRPASADAALASLQDTPSAPRPADVAVAHAAHPHIRRHFLAARRRGWPRTLILNRAGADQRRERLLEGVPTRDGFDRDEYPPAVGRGKGKGLERGRHPRGWKADVRYVPSSENRSHGSVLGLKLRRFCDGTRFRYVFY